MDQPPSSFGEMNTSSLKALVESFPTGSDDSSSSSLPRPRRTTTKKTLPHPQKGSSSGSASIPNNKVTFQLDNVQTHLIPCLEDLDEEEKRDTWYTHDDFKLIKLENSKTLKSVEKKSRKWNKEHCYRGLDRRNELESKRRTRDIKKSIHLTLKEQQRQGEEKVHDPALLATVYRALAVLYTIEARRTGKFDEAAATEAYKLSESERSSESDKSLEQPDVEYSRGIQRSNSDSRRPRRRGLLKSFSQRGISESPPVLLRKAFKKDSTLTDSAGKTGTAGRSGAQSRIQKMFRK